MISSLGFRILVALTVLFSYSSLSFAEAENQLTILISGQSHASLYPCNCPQNPLGGVARRAALIKEIRDSDKNVLVIEAGGSFGGGKYDANVQTIELDKKRTKFYMKSLTEMDYDAFLVSSQEFHFGDSFLNEVMAQYELNYLSANLKGDFLPYIIKEVDKVKVAIIGISDDEAKNQTQVPFQDPGEILGGVIQEVRDNQKADFVIVLSYLDEKSSQNILEQIEGVNIWISSGNPFVSPSHKDINETFLCIPGWETRELTKITLDLSSLSIVSTEHIPLGNDIVNNPEISSIIPGCFSDNNCKKLGYVGKCQNAGRMESKCDYSAINPQKLTIIKPSICRTCNIEQVLEDLKRIIPNLDVQQFEESDKLAQELIDKLDIKMLPAYLIEETGEEAENSNLNEIASKVDGYYMLEPRLTGVSYVVGREKIPNKLDLFFDIASENIVEILGVLQELKDKRQDIDVSLNFLAIEDAESGLIAKSGKYEIEEFLRCACIDKYYPDQFYYYLSCRLSDINSSWWDDCLVKFDMDPGKIKGCARTQEGQALLKNFIKLTQELEIVFGPAFFINNQEIFNSEGVPSLEELEQLFSDKVGE